jgi:sulfate adenylyltransferase subunit 2
MTTAYLKNLEAESIFIIREVAASFERPVLMYSIGKDSAVLLHLAAKAFYPSPVAFPLLHIDTGWKFREMIKFRDETAKRLGVELLIHTNEEGLKRELNPFDHGSIYTDVMKTEALKQALTLHQFNCAIGGARRDEEKSRAKERIFSFRSVTHQWDPKNQRPEFWSLYNTSIKPGESVRVFPLSNWTEADVWNYIREESVPVVPLYFAAKRLTVERDGRIIMVDDHRMRLEPGEKPEERLIRFRTLGCYPLTAAVESDAADINAVVEEIARTSTSERSGRLIDHDQTASMEKRKVEGYF